MRRLVPADPFGIGRRRAHAELDRAVDHGERLPLAVDVPAAAAPILEPAQLAIDGLELLLPAPLPQGPGGRPVDACIGVVAADLEEPGDERLALAGREALGPVGAQCQDQRPPHRGLGVEQDRIHRRPFTRPSATLSPLGGARGRCRDALDVVEFRGDDSRVGPQRAEPVDDEAAEAGIGAVPQQGPDRLGLAQADQGHRRPRLPLGEPVLRLLLDHGSVPDRCRRQWSPWRDLGHRPGDGAIVLRDQVAGPAQMGGGVETRHRDGLDGRVGGPDGGISPIGMPGLHDLGDRGIVADRVELGILVHPAEVDVAALDQAVEQADGAGRQRTPLPRVLRADGPGGEGPGAGGVVTQVDVLGLALERRVQRPNAWSVPSPSSAATMAARASLARSGSSRFRNRSSSARASGFLPSRARAMAR